MKKTTLFLSLPLVFALLFACNYDKQVENSEQLVASDSIVATMDTVDLTMLPDTVLARVYLDSAKVLIDSTKYNEALIFTKYALELYQGSVGEIDILTAKAYNRLSSYYSILNKVDSSLTLAQKSIDISIKILGNGNLIEASGYNNIGNAWLNGGEYNKALSSFKKAVKITKTLSIENTTTAGYYNGIGLAYWYNGNYEQALDFYIKSLEIRVKELGSNHPEVAKSFNNIGLSWAYIGNFKKAIKNYEKAIKITKENYGHVHLEIGKLNNNLGLIWNYLGHYNKAEKCYNIASTIFSKKLGLNSREVAVSYQNIGKNFVDKGNYIKGLKFSKKALSIFLDQQDSAHPDITKAYNNIGTCLRRTGDYDLAIEYSEKALKLWLNKFGLQNPEVAIIYGNIGSIWFDKGDYDKALTFSQKSLEINLKAFGMKNIDVASDLTEVGIIYMNKNNFEKAIEYFEKAGNIILNQLGQNHLGMSSYYGNMGTVYSYKGDYEKANENIERALKINIAQLGGKHPEVARCFHQLGEIWQGAKQYQKALSFFKKALECLNYDFSKNCFFSKISDLDRFIDSFIGLKNCYANLNLVDKRYSDSLFLHVNDMMCFENFIQSNFMNLSTRQFYLSKSKPIYEGAIQIYLSRNKKEELLETFTFSEKIKSRLLTEEVKREYNVHFAALSDSLKEKDHDLKIDIGYYEKKKFQSQYETDPPIDSLVSIYQNKIFDLKRERDQLIETFKTDYPNYWNLKYNFEVTSVKDVQSNLKNDQALIEYFTGDSSIFIFVVTKDTFDIKEVKHDFPLADWISEMRDGMFAYYNPQNLPLPNELDSLNQQYSSYAYQLYEKLLLPIKQEIPDETKLIIVPDGVLGYLPFDALLTAPLKHSDGFRTADYLIKNHQISYAYSATLWLEMRNKEVAPKKGILAMAPSFPKRPEELALLAENKYGIRDSLYELKYSIPEIEAVDSIWGADLLSDTTAQIQDFLEQAEDYRILHLSTHGKADDRVGDYCFLAFTQKDSSDNLLYVRDLYNIRLNADMVVLSACETGLGELQRGEGILSLTRGFVYAGAKSIISTLWSVNEISTKEIMESFYTNLKKGMDKDEALRQAKLSYLDSSTEPYPYHWAAFTAVGDMSPIEIGWPWWYYAVGSLMILGLVLFLRKLF